MNIPKYNMLKLTAPLLLSASLLGAYIVKDKDTLWDLGAQFMGNPFQWREIWESNPQVQNPNRIYPGDTLNINGSKKMPEAQYEPMENINGLVSQGNVSQDVLRKKFRNSLGVLGDKEDEFAEYKRNKADYNYNSDWSAHHLNKHMIFVSPSLVSAPSPSKTFINEYSLVPFGKDRGGVIQPFQKLMINAGTKKGLTQGEILELFEPNSDRIEVKGKTLVPYKVEAIAKLEECSENSCKAIVQKVYGKLTIENAKSVKIMPRTIAAVEQYSAVEQIELSKMPKIKYRWQITDISVSRMYVAIDQGKNNGLSIGDGVSVLRKNEYDAKLSPETIGVGIVVSTNEYVSTILITNLTNSAYNLSLSDWVAITHKAKLIDSPQEEK